MTDPVYLDFNATAPARPEVVEAVAAALAAGGNASSVHAAGRAARARIEDARRAVAALVGAAPDGVVFTGSGTEANNQALRCSGRARALISAIEHESVLGARDDAERIPVGADGVVDLAALDAMLAGDDRPAVVSVMLANNETGAIQPLAELARIAHARGALVHSDAVQAGGRIPVDMAALGIDLLSLSAHKMAGPQGIGALVARDPSLIGRLIHGGGQERGLRAGTENVAGICGFAVAARMAAAELDRFAALARLRDRMEAAMRAVDPAIVVFAAAAPRLPNTSKVATPGLAAETQVIGLDLAGVAISAGSACSAGKIEAPYVLSAMGVDDALARSAVRISLGWGTTDAHIEAFLAAWRALRARSRGATAAE